MDLGQLGDRPKRRGVGGGLAAPTRQEDNDRQRLHAAGVERQEPQRGGVRPLHVVDDEHDGPGGGEIGDQPM